MSSCRARVAASWQTKSRSCGPVSRFSLPPAIPTVKLSDGDCSSRGRRFFRHRSHPTLSSLRSSGSWRRLSDFFTILSRTKLYAAKGKALDFERSLQRAITHEAADFNKAASYAAPEQKRRYVMNAPLPQVLPLTVLVVDDDSGVRRIMGRELEQAGYHVLTAGNGAEALTVLKQSGTEVHLVLCDLLMPNLDGYQLADLLAALPDAP